MRELGEELIVDIARYRNQLKRRTLFCFVYDPDRLAKNPRGFEDDIQQMSDQSLAVRAMIIPK
jgi:hypothetical protein